MGLINLMNVTKFMFFALNVQVIYFVLKTEKKQNQTKSLRKQKKTEFQINFKIL